jgi:hypothetical protein
LDAIPLTSAQTFSLIPGTLHTVSAASPQSIGAGSRYLFTGWSDGGAATHTVVIPSSAVNYIASFQIQYQLTTSAGSGGTISPSSGFYAAGPVTIMSSAASVGRSLA